MADLVRSEARKVLDQFYDRINSLPKLIGDLANSVAEAQRRNDEGYLKDLAEFAKVVSTLVGGNSDAADKFLNLFKAMGPTRQQITETVVEVKTDLQMTTASELSGGVEIGITAPFAVTLNASYMRRSGYDVRAAAVVRCTMNSIPASEAVMTALIQRAGEVQHAELPTTMRYKSLMEAFQQAFQPVTSPPSSPA